MLLPVFMTLVFGIVVFGSYLAVVHGLQQLAAEAARSSIAGMSATERTSLATSYVTSNIGNIYHRPERVRGERQLQRGGHVPVLTAVRSDAAVDDRPFGGDSVRRILGRA